MRSVYNGTARRGRGTARRVLGLAILLFFALPFGLSVAGCGHKAAPVVYCNAGDSGPVVGQVASITLSPSLATAGESLNYGQIGQALSASALDCKGNSVTVTHYTFATSNMAIADINPNTGQVCGGTWNRNSGGGVADFTTCSPPSPLPAAFTGPAAYVTATASGAVSNAIPVYIHPTVTGIVLGPASTSCTTDPGTDCCPAPTTGTPIVAPVYTGTGCLSQSSVGQLIARVYQNGDTAAADNITCQVGHLTFSPQTSGNIVTIDQNGIATANQPGATVITASVSNSSTTASAGYFSTCPPASITLAVPGQPNAASTGINVSLNNLQPLTATVVDTNGVTLTGLTLEYLSTTPQTIPAVTASVTPAYPGAATITAVCNPPTCNYAPFSQIGLYGNGKPITSNGIGVTSTGTSATVLYMGSTGSQYLQPHDFSTNQTSSLIKLQYVPNSMVITQDGSEIYLGSSQGIMSVSTAQNTQGGVNTAVTGTVLAVSPDGTTVVVTDPVRQTISLYSPTAQTVTSATNGVGLSAAWTPDSQTVYVTTTAGTLLTHTSFTSWQTTNAGEVYSHVAVTVPSVGAYFSGPTSLDGRSYCPSSTIGVTGTPPTVTNTFSPIADSKPVSALQLATTNDGKHVLSANIVSNTTNATLSDLGTTLPTGACPATVPNNYFTSTLLTPAPLPLTGVTATAIDSIVPASNSVLAFVTYTGSSGLLPLYTLASGAAGTLRYITLGNGATAASAPVSGVFSTDNLSFFAGTGAANGNSVDNDVHIFSITGATAAETGILSPTLPPANGNGAAAAVNLLVQHVKKSQS